MIFENFNTENFDIQELTDSVIISFGKFESLDVINEIDKRISNNIPDAIRRYDGHEVNMNDTDGRFFAYGKNAEKLFKLMLPILKEYRFLEKASVYLNFIVGDTNRELEFNLSNVTAD